MIAIILSVKFGLVVLVLFTVYQLLKGAKGDKPLSHFLIESYPVIIFILGLAAAMLYLTFLVIR